MHSHFPSRTTIIFLASISTAAGACLAAHAQTAPPRAPAADEPVHMENYVVTATPFRRDQAELASATNILAGQNLLLAQQSSLGATLDAQPGIASTSFGPGASRPVIRGLGGDRVRVLENGADTIDASVVSPDHAVALEPLFAKRIEVVRGPAALLYGGSAVGGVVNVLDNSIPENLPGAAFTGRIEGRFASAAEERTGIAAFDGAAGDRLAWHAGGLRRESDGVRVPSGSTASQDNRDRLINSAVSTSAYRGGLSYVGSSGFAGISTGRFETDYGTVAEEDVTIHLVQKRLDFEGALARPFGIFSGARARAGFADYAHTEFEGGEAGTVFKNKGFDARAELLHENLWRLDGAWGAQVSRSDFSALGEEAFLPPSVTEKQALFVFEEMPLGPVRLQFGARADWQRIKADRDSGVVARNDFTLSASAGVVYSINGYSIAASVAHTERAPSAQELFADGPHAGTNAFEIGDPALGAERSFGADIGVRKRAGRVTGTFSIFANRFGGYIFERTTGETEDGLAVYRFTQHDAFFHGAELELIVHLHETRSHTLDLRLTADTVRAQDRDASAPLPRITPNRLAMTLDYRGPVFSASVGVQTAGRARHLAPGEEPTAGYGLLNASAVYRVPSRGGAGRVVTELFLRGTNLSDQEARSHVSLLKTIAPLPGRDITLGVRMEF